MDVEYCLRKKYKINLELLESRYELVDDTGKIVITLRLMEELKRLSLNIKNIKLGGIKENNIDIYRKLFLELEDMKLINRYYNNKLKELKNRTLEVCKKLRDDERVNRFLYVGEISKRFRYGINKEELKTLKILKKELCGYINHIIIPNYKLSVRNNRSLRADFLVYVDYFKGNRLIVEYDGRSHYDESYIYYRDENILRDKIKDSYCVEEGISMIRYNDHKMFNNLLPELLKKINNGKVIKSCHYKGVKMEYV